MEVTKNQKTAPVLYENKQAFSYFMAGLETEEKAMSRIAQLYNALELGEFTEEALANIYNPEYFKQKFEGSIKSKIEKLDLPKAIKDKLYSETIYSGSYQELVQKLESLQTNRNSVARIPMWGGTRSFEVKLEYFEVRKGLVSLVKNVRELAIKQFQIIGDSPSKIKVFAKLEEVAKQLTEVSSLLKESGLYDTHYHSVIEQSPFFTIENDKYKVDVGILL